MLCTAALHGNAGWDTLFMFSHGQLAGAEEEQQLCLPPNHHWVIAFRDVLHETAIEPKTSSYDKE